MLIFFFFFFQAEDGIRDIGVTGVQTCALPILSVAIAPDATNANVGDLVADLNAALSFAGFARQVAAGNVGNRIMLTAPTGSTLHIDASAGDTATTELHLPGDGAPPSWSQHVFLGAG